MMELHGGDSERNYLYKEIRNEVRGHREIQEGTWYRKNIFRA